MKIWAEHRLVLPGYGTPGGRWRPATSPSPPGAAGLPKDSVINVTQLTTIDERQLSNRTGRLPAELLDELDAGLRLALGL